MFCSPELCPRQSAAQRWSKKCGEKSRQPPPPALRLRASIDFGTTRRLAETFHKPSSAHSAWSDHGDGASQARSFHRTSTLRATHTSATRDYRRHSQDGTKLPGWSWGPCHGTCAELLAATIRHGSRMTARCPHPRSWLKRLMKSRGGWEVVGAWLITQRRGHKAKPGFADGVERISERSVGDSVEEVELTCTAHRSVTKRV